MNNVNITGSGILSKQQKTNLNELNKINFDLKFEISRFKIKQLHEYIITEKIDIDLTSREIYHKKT